MKNRRDICLAKDAGTISYPGLPGHIKTGCVASPAYKSRYCQNHKARSCETANCKILHQSLLLSLFPYNYSKELMCMHV